jgi:formate-dependent nitrite reductase membrane component NrfD
MAMEAAGLVVLEVLAIIFFIQAAYKTPDSRESAERLLDNRPFMVGYFVFGLGVPLALMLAVAGAFLGMDLAANLSVVVGGAALGLLGGLILRWAVLTCGTLPTLNIAGFQFRRIARPKETRPDIGMLPPS